MKDRSNSGNEGTGSSGITWILGFFAFVAISVGSVLVAMRVLRPSPEFSDPKPVGAPVADPRGDPQKSSPDGKATSKDNELAVQDFQEFKRFLRERDSEARSEFERLIVDRHRHSMGEEWEYAEAAKLAKCKSDDEFARNKLVVSGVNAFLTDDLGQIDRFVYLRQSILPNRSSNDGNKYTAIAEEWFAPVVENDGCRHARRYLSERLADLASISVAAQPLKALNLDARDLPLLNWATGLIEEDLRASFRPLVDSSMPLIGASECDAAALVAASWLPKNGEPIKMNPVDEWSTINIIEMRQHLAEERQKTKSGLSDEEKLKANQTYDAIERMLHNEQQRSSRITKKNWQKDLLLKENASARNSENSRVMLTSGHGDGETLIAVDTPRTPNETSAVTVNH